MEIKGILTFALGGVILTFLWAILNLTANASIGADPLLGIVVIGFLGFLLVGIGLSVIIEDANTKAKQKP